MKSQDVLILLKLISLHQRTAKPEEFSVRALADVTGISKSEVSASLNRSIETGLAKLDRKEKMPTTNKQALLEFIVYGLCYVFPARPGATERGLLTCFEAPGLQGLLSSLDEYHYVWPYAEGKDSGQTITALYRTAPFAAKQDPQLYQYMALVDAIRLGNAREVATAKRELKHRLHG